LGTLLAGSEPTGIGSVSQGAVGKTIEDTLMIEFQKKEESAELGIGALNFGLFGMVNAMRSFQVNVL